MDSSYKLLISQFRKTALKAVHELYWYFPTVMLFRRIDSHVCNNALDIGCETGNSTIWLSLATQARNIFCIDRKISWISAFELNRKYYGKEASLLASQASVETLPYKNDSFDIIFCRSVLQYTDMQKAIPEMKRVLAPKGRLFIIANMAKNPMVSLYRKLRESHLAASDSLIQKYLDLAAIEHWKQTGSCRFHSEHFLISPLLFPILKQCPYPINLLFLASFHAVERLVCSVFPVLNNYCWYAFVELRK